MKKMIVFKWLLKIVYPPNLLVADQKKMPRVAVVAIYILKIAKVKIKIHETYNC